MYDQIEIDSSLARNALMLGNPEGLPAIERLAAAAGILMKVRQNKDTLFLTTGFSWGHTNYSVQVVALRQLQDGSAVLIPSFSAQLGRNWQAYIRPSFFLGNQKSEYASLMSKMVLTMGLRYNL
jgi:hypothetical protein